MRDAEFSGAFGTTRRNTACKGRAFRASVLFCSLVATAVCQGTIQISVADYDNDGDSDIYLSGLGKDRLFRNQGDGRFQDVTRAAGLGNPGFGTSSAWLDYDKDGLLDLFVANYVQWTLETDIFCILDGSGKSYCTPESYKGASPLLYRNLGGGKFRDVSKKSKIYDESNKGLGLLVFD